MGPVGVEALDVEALDVEALDVEALDVEAANRHAEAWDELASRGLEPNPFMAPGFCLPALRHLGADANLIVLMVWDHRPGRPRHLLAVCPLARSTLPLWPLSSVWFHDLAALGVPLLARDRADDALLAILGWIGRHLPARAALVIAALDRDGPTARLLDDVSARTGRGLRFLDERRRAVLRAGPDVPPAGLGALSRRRGKELLRQRRRLEERGGVVYESVSAPQAADAALETFLVLEARGWKGRAGTALLAHPRRAAFTRDMIGRMTAKGHGRIDVLRVGDHAIAAGIVLTSQDRQYFWKTAFAEDHATLSPGVQFALELTREQQSRPELALTDSCAMPDHPMIDRLWPSRIVIADAVLGVRSGGRSRFRSALALEQIRRQGRAALKRFHTWLRAAKSHIDAG